LPLVIWDRKQRSAHGARYFLSCIVGAPAVDSSKIHVPLIQVRKRHGLVRAEFEPEKYTWKWVGRFVLLIGFTIQLSFTFFLVCRRIHIVGISGFPLDIHSFACCIGGFAIAFSSIVIHVSPIRWRMEKESLYYEFEDDEERTMQRWVTSALSGLVELTWLLQDMEVPWLVLGVFGVPMASSGSVWCSHQYSHTAGVWNCISAF